MWWRLVKKKGDLATVVPDYPATVGGDDNDDCSRLAFNSAIRLRTSCTIHHISALKSIQGGKYSTFTFKYILRTMLS